jgi:hypothetical protein
MEDLCCHNNSCRYQGFLVSEFLKTVIFDISGAENLVLKQSMICIGFRARLEQINGRGQGSPEN